MKRGQVGKLIKSLSNDKKIRYYVVDTTDIIEEIKKRHNPSIGALIAMGKVATFATLYGPSILADKERATIKIEGNGTIGKIYCDVNNKGEVKIMATNPQAELTFENEKPNWNSVIGTAGTITVIKDLGMKENYSAISPILKGDITESFSYFMQISEQKPSAIGVGVNFDENLNVLSSGGYMAQLLPDATEENYNYLETSVKILPNPTQMFKDFSLNESLEMLSRNDYKIIEEVNPKFHCDCTKERFIDKIVLLNKEDLKHIFSEKDNITVVCEFCKTSYEITKEEANGK